MHVIFLQFHLPPFLFCSLPWNLQCPFVFLFMGWWAMLWPLLHFRHEACALACLVSTAVFVPFKGKKKSFVQTDNANYFLESIAEQWLWDILIYVATPFHWVSRHEFTWVLEGCVSSPVSCLCGEPGPHVTWRGHSPAGARGPGQQLLPFLHGIPLQFQVANL